MISLRVSRIHACTGSLFILKSRVYIHAGHTEIPAICFIIRALRFIRENRTRSLLWKSRCRWALPRAFHRKLAESDGRERTPRPYLRWLETSTCNAKLHRMEIRVLEGPTINSVNDGITACNVTSLPVSRFLLPSFLFLPLSLCLRCDIR